MLVSRRRTFISSAQKLYVYVPDNMCKLLLTNFLEENIETFGDLGSLMRSLAQDPLEDLSTRSAEENGLRRYREALSRVILRRIRSLKLMLVQPRTSPKASWNEGVRARSFSVPCRRDGPLRFGGKERRESSSEPNGARAAIGAGQERRRFPQLRPRGGTYDSGWVVRRCVCLGKLLRARSPEL